MTDRVSRVLQIHKFFFDRGGLERYFFLLLDDLERRGHDVVTLSMTDPRNRPSPYARYFVSPVTFKARPTLRDSAASVRALGRAIYSPEAKRKTRELVELTRPDVAHVHEVHHHLSPSVLVALREAEVPVVLSAHEYQLICPTVGLYDGRGICEACRGHRYWEPLKRRCSNGSLGRSAAAALEATVHYLTGAYDERHVQVIVAGSRFTLNKLAEFGIPRERLEYLPYVLDAAEWQPSAAVARASHFTLVSRLVAGKGIETFLRALRLSGDPPARIVGDGPGRAELEELASSLGLTNTRFTGFVANEELRLIMESSRAVIVPSQVYETFSYSVYEAMALGRPVVASRLGPIPELVTESETGFLFAPGNPEDLAGKLAVLTADAGKAERMGREARRQFLERNNVEAHYETLMRIYALARRRRSEQRTGGRLPALPASVSNDARGKG
jgi:glycosyltransferase involved in cell wall biosynthesis